MFFVIYTGEKTYFTPTLRCFVSTVIVERDSPNNEPLSPALSPRGNQARRASIEVMTRGFYGERNPDGTFRRLRHQFG